MSLSARVLVFFAVAFLLEANCEDLTSDLASWQKIFNYACGTPGIKDEMMAKQFYQCYTFLDLKGQQIFETCQNEIFGLLLGSKANLDTACKNAKADSLTTYIACVKKGYENSGGDYEKAADIVNACDGRIFGLDKAECKTA